MEGQRKAPALSFKIPSRSEIDDILSDTSAVRNFVPRHLSPPSSSSSSSSSSGDVDGSGGEPPRGLVKSRTTESVVSTGHDLSSPPSLHSPPSSSSSSSSLLSTSPPSGIQPVAQGQQRGFIVMPKARVGPPIVIAKGSTGMKPPVPLLRGSSLPSVSSSSSSSSTGPRLVSPRAPTVSAFTPTFSAQTAGFSSPASVGMEGPNVIYVNKRQERNPVLSFVRAVRWTFIDEAHSHESKSTSSSASLNKPLQSQSPPERWEGEREEGKGKVFYTMPKLLDPDFVISSTCCALFLSVKYHISNPNYITNRIQMLPRAYSFRIVLCLVDTEDVIEFLESISLICINTACTLILGWSNAEIARYLETYKLYEKKRPDIIQTKVEDNHLARLTECLTSIKPVNKTDVQKLANNFGTLKSIVGASLEELALCPGLGEKKILQLYETFTTSFKDCIKTPSVNSLVAETVHVSIPSVTASPDETKDIEETEDAKSQEDLSG